MYQDLSFESFKIDRQKTFSDPSGHYIVHDFNTDAYDIHAAYEDDTTFLRKLLITYTILRAKK